MSLELFLAFATYAFVSSITPGPNNTMLLASGVHFGFARTIPHILGVSIGFLVMVLAVGAGMKAILDNYPMVYTALRWISGAYLLWFAWKLATAGPLNDRAKQTRPMSFLAAAAFQWVNPKCWIMAVGATAAYMPPESGVFGIIIVAFVYAMINAPSIATWAAFGTVIRRWLVNPTTMRIFNLTAAGLQVVSLYPLITSH